MFFNFNEFQRQAVRNIPLGLWRKRFDSHETRWGGHGSAAGEVDDVPPAPDVIDAGAGGMVLLAPLSAVVFEKEVRA
jgi:hypothetical protein